MNRTAATHTDPVGDEALARQAAALRARVAEAAGRAHRDPGEVTIMAVTKTLPLERVLAAYALGFTVVGENRVQEAVAKQDQLAALPHPPALRWELIGRLQSNKAALAVARFARIQSVDSLRLAEELDRRVAQRIAAGRTPTPTSPPRGESIGARGLAVGERAAGERAGAADAADTADTANTDSEADERHALPILLEVNVAGEASKAGLAPDAVVAVARAIAALPHLRPQGLMTVAPLVTDAEAVRPIFRRLRELRDQLREAVPLGADGGWPDLSMGMTDDYAIAVEEGATILRIGRGLFGARA